ncbi:hypothetical protein [Corynebacterium phocae]|uniref:hypothetical protein n=1 Tax=Corynebacterium phocae TaxID=161895 RepID=UPI0009527FF9|nr:hypothetical protein [Corynebacterium phocae]
MEKWTLLHPETGLIEVERGYDAEFADLDPSWPHEPKPFEDVPVDAGLAQRVRGKWEVGKSLAAPAG